MVIGRGCRFDSCRGLSPVYQLVESTDAPLEIHEKDAPAGFRDIILGICYTSRLVNLGSIKCGDSLAIIMDNRAGA